MTLRCSRAAALAALIFALPATFLTAGPAGASRLLRVSQPQLVYATMALGPTTGITNVYQTDGNLVTTLGHGGGGPVAVDAQQNVYIIQADYDSDAFIENSRIFVYARGATKPTRALYAKGFQIEAMTIAADGTVFAAGQDFPNTNVFAVVAFAPGSRTPQPLPVDSRDPIFPSGLGLDASGDLFAGWMGGGGRCQVSGLQGCVDELPATQNSWQLRLPAPSAANSIVGGPLVRDDGSLVLLASGYGAGYTYLETVRPNHRLPSQVVSLPILLCCSGSVALGFDEAGRHVWAMQTGLNFTGEAYAISYPSGTVSASFLVTPGGSQPYVATGMAVSPAFFPSSRFRR